MSADICPVCGGKYDGSWHPCPGPREDRLERIAREAEEKAGRLFGAEVVPLPGDDVTEVVQGLRRIRRHAPDEEAS